MSVQPLSNDVREVSIPPVVKKNILLLAVSQAITGAGTQLIPALGAIQVVSLLGNATFAGITTSLMGFARMISSYPIGRLTDRRGRKIGFFIGLWLCLVGSLAVGLATLGNSFWLFALGVLLFGGGIGAVQQMRVAAADMYPPSRRSEGMSLILMGSLLGAGISPLIVILGQFLGRAWQLNEMALAWLVVPLLILPCFALIAKVQPDPKHMAQNLGKYYPEWVLQLGKAKSTKSVSRVNPIRTAAIVSAVAVQGQMAMLMAMTALALKRQDYTLSQISLSVTIHVIGMFALSWPIGRLADRIGRKPVILMGLATSGLGALLVGLGHTYLVITTGTFLVGLGWAGAFLGSNTIVTDVTPANQRGQAVGLLEVWSNLAGMLLPLLGGVIVENFGLNTLGFFGVLLVIVPAILMSRIEENTPGNYA